MRDKCRDARVMSEKSENDREANERRDRQMTGKQMNAVTGK